MHAFSAMDRVTVEMASRVLPEGHLFPWPAMVRRRCYRRLTARRSTTSKAVEGKLNENEQ